MKTVSPQKPNDTVVFVPSVSPNKKLKDRRKLQSYGNLHFGTIGQAARNLGVTMKVVEGGLIFSAPKVRLQMLVEKLHFSLIRYSQIS